MTQNKPILGEKPLFRINRDRKTYFNLSTHKLIHIFPNFKEVRRPTLFIYKTQGYNKYDIEEYKKFE